MRIGPKSNSKRIGNYRVGDKLPFSPESALGNHAVKSTDSAHKKPISFKPKTPLGKKLWEIRRRIVASGAALLTWEEIEREIAE